MSQINTVYKKAYLKSIGQDDVSKKRKREEALEFMDGWIKEQEESHGYERAFNSGESDWLQISSKIRQEVGAAVRRKALRDGIPTMGNHKIAQEIKEASERRIEEELGAQEDYAREVADESFQPRIPLALILSIRRLVK